MLQSLITLQVPFEALSPTQKSMLANRHSITVDDPALKRFPYKKKFHSIQTIHPPPQIHINN